MKELQKIDTAQLINIAQSNEKFALEVKEKTEALLSKIPKNFEDTPLHVGDKMESQLKQAIKQIEVPFQSFKSRRMLFTKTFDDVKKHFTTLEKDTVECIEEIKNVNSKWNAEKLRRIRIEEERKEKARQFEIEKREYKEYAEQHYSNIMFQISSTIAKNNKQNFYAQDTEEELRAFCEKLKQDNKEGYKNTILKSLSANNASATQDWQKQILQEMKADLHKMLAESVKKIIESDAILLQQMPTRIEQLKVLDAKAKEEEKKALEAKLLAEHKAEEARKQAELEEKHRNARIAELAKKETEAKEAIELSKGTRVSEVYDIQNHAELAQIVAFYMENEFANVDLETMLKRLSFMLTFANRELKKGTVISNVTKKEEVK